MGVAIEALKSFNAIDDPRRTKEYLDISQNELQRLNLLVDKVLKLSMFEKKEIELKYELLNLADVVDEVVTSMRLQTEKYRATVTVNTEGDCTLPGRPVAFAECGVQFTGQCTEVWQGKSCGADQP